MKSMVDKINSTDFQSESDEEQIKAIFKYSREFMTSDFSLAQLSMQFVLFVSTHKAEVTWLDEIAEALCNCATGMDYYYGQIKRLDYKVIMKISESSRTFQDLLDHYCSMTYYSIGVIAYRLIQLNSDEDEDKKNLSKLDILHGGIESRFIPTLSKETRTQIEGSFKITNDRVM